MHKYSKLDRPEVLSRIFFPVRTKKTPLPARARDVTVEVGENLTLGCRFYEAAAEAPTLLYFHGNGETVGDYDPIAPEYCRHGLNIFVATYRGYGWSNGSPDVTSMFGDAVAVGRFVTSWLQQSGFSGPLFVMGRSLGSASAIEVALEMGGQLKGLVIESGFAETLPLAESLGIDITGLEEQDCFNNCEKIARIKLPTLIMHGARDQLIPVRQAEKLQMHSDARNKQFLVIPGADHNSLIAVAGDHYFAGIRKFADEVCGINTWRQRRRKFNDNSQVS